MAGHREVSYLWNDSSAPSKYGTGVSLHSHTNQSCETLDFLANIGRKVNWIRTLLDKAEARARANHRIAVDYAKSYWTPPLTPRLAFDLESGQIEKLGLQALVSLSDHDSIKAPMLLRTVASARHIPVSVEWSVPFGGDQSFHLGIHNLPSESGQSWMEIFDACTRNPSDARVHEILAALHALPNVLIVFNHPMWDLYMVGATRHKNLVRTFMAENGEFIHALELNGLRVWEENRAVKAMAREWNKLLISGGDRHGMEPNANINLTDATNFTDFVHEIRYEGKSHVLFMPQYAEPWKHRLLQAALDVVRDHPEFPLGSRRWDDRVFHPDVNGVARPLSQLWPDGSAPWYITYSIMAVRMMGSQPMYGSLRMAWDDSREVQLVLGD